MERDEYYKMLSAMKKAKVNPLIISEVERVGYQPPLGFQSLFPLTIGAIIGQKIRFETARKIRAQIYTYCQGRNFKIEDFVLKVWRQKSSLNYLRSIGLQEFHINAIRHVLSIFELPSNATQEWNKPNLDDEESRLESEPIPDIEIYKGKIPMDQDIPYDLLNDLLGKIRGIGKWTIENIKLTYLMSLNSEEYHQFKLLDLINEKEFKLSNDKIIVRNFKYLFGAFVKIEEIEDTFPLEWRPHILWTLWRGWTITPDNQAPFRQI